ncbi:uncharacterized protein [Pyrus communis]|uniref:uncharacterized protein n=1 Tax=Pyrus communis TaxID=23211 RepID=UPI0035BF37FA
MGAFIISLLNTHFDLENMGASGGEFYSKMAPFPRLFTLSVSSLLLALLRFFSKFFLRVSFGNGERSGMNNSCRSPNPLSEETNQMVSNNNLVETEALPGKVDSCSASLVSEETNQMVSNNPVEPEALPERADSEISESDGDSELGDVDGAEASKPSFVFKFEYQTREILSRSNTEYEFLADEFNLFKEEGPEFTSSSSSSRKYEFKAGENVSCFVEEAKVATFTVEGGGDHEEIAHEFSGGECKEDEESDKKSAMEDARSDEELMGSLESDSDREEVDSHEVNFLSEKDFGSPSLGFLSAEDFGERDELPNFDMGYESDCFDEEDEDINEQIRELQELPSSSNPEGFSRKDETPIERSENAEKPDVRNSVTNDSEDSNTLETLWEHQELLEQLKMELKKVRATGLPTILEESESPNMDDLKPWKIDEKAHQGDRMGELQKFHRIYRERMRKFDILNYQKLYAIGFLQSKDPLQSFPSSSKSSAPAIPSFLSQNFWRCKPKKESDSDPMEKFIRELHGDLEAVYVGQLCLSWEILQWQYEKAFKLWESAPYGNGSYNVVAGEFQQFQVHLVRFVENECFQGPRVENYVKNRCITRHLLQVPVIRRDNLKERKKARRKGKDGGAITSDILVEILEESIRTIWRFIRADKYANCTLAHRRRRQEEELEESDLKLFTEIQTDLHKKNMKLKERLRCGNCILKRFKKHEDEGTDHLYFFSQVDMKLVARVLNMSTITTEQLVWCHNKLSKINFVNRKLLVDPSILLFPC